MTKILCRRPEHDTKGQGPYAFIEIIAPEISQEKTIEVL